MKKIKSGCSLLARAPRCVYLADRRVAGFAGGQTLSDTANGSDGTRAVGVGTSNAHTGRNVSSREITPIVTFRVKTGATTIGNDVGHNCVFLGGFEFCCICIQKKVNQAIFASLWSSSSRVGSRSVGVASSPPASGSSRMGKSTAERSWKSSSSSCWRKVDA